MSLKRFRGWEPTTTYQHARGRSGPVLTSSTVDAEWDEQEQGWMLALAQYEATLCPQCKGSLVETTKAENEDAYEPDLPYTCHRCVAIARSYEAYADQPRPHTFVHRVKPPKALRRDAGVDGVP